MLNYHTDSVELRRVVQAKRKMQTLLPLVAATLLVSAWQEKEVAAAAAPACQRRCGDVDIPYPFGIGRGCYLDSGDLTFSLTCSLAAGGGGGYRPFSSDTRLEVLGVDLRRGQVRVRNRINSWCYNGTSRSMDAQSNWGYDMSRSSFRVSDADNRLTVIGCDALGYVGSPRDEAAGDRYTVGCRSMCPGGAGRLANGSCSGMGCCQAAIPPGLSRYQVWFEDKHTSSGGRGGGSPCSYAVLAEAASFEFRSTYVTTGEFMDATGGQVPLVLDWVVAGNKTCRAAQRDTAAYACVSANSECVDSRNGPGYLCNCTRGYQGNPYVINGCQDINECLENETAYPCSAPGTCTNSDGGFQCSCPAGKTGNAYTGTCQDKISGRPWQVAIGISVGVVVLAMGMSCTYAVQEKRRLAVIKARHFRQHGGLLLFEEMKSKQQGAGGGFTLFTREELQESTANFDERHVLGKGGNGTVYRGTLRDGTAVAIKRCRLADAGERQQREFGKETLILSQINHKNIVKLYGCCLEVEVPMLVYQFIPNGTLYQLIHGGGAGAGVPLAVRMRIAHETAEALAYLHSMASPPIIHGDVKSPNILLDENYAAKVSDFGASALAPPTDEAHLVTFVQGTCGYLDPEYMQTCRLTEKSDVYSFGVVLLELLTCRKALNLAAPDEERSLAAHFLSAARDRRLDSLLDARTRSEVGAETLELVAGLAKRCLEMSGEKRPSMREVAEELDRIRKISSSSPSLQHRPPCLGEVEVHSSSVGVGDANR